MKNFTISWNLLLMSLFFLPSLLLAQEPAPDLASISNDYARFGLQPGSVPEKFEDGARTTGAPGTFEWWYFDALLQDGSAVVIVFYSKDFSIAKCRKTPTIAVTISRPDGTIINRRMKFPVSETNFATDSCNIQMGPNYFRGNLKNYEIHYEESGFSVTANLTRTTAESWRPKTGHVVFGEDQSKFFGWLVAVPSGLAQVAITNNGTTENLAGLGYHDHNWANTRMQDLFNHWNWSRSSLGPYTIIAAEIVADKQFNKEPVNVIHISKDGKLKADDSEALTLYRTYGELDDQFGKDISNKLFYLYDDPSTGYRYEYYLEKKATLLASNLISVAFPNPITRALVALVSDIDDGAYYRFFGSSKLRVFKDGVLLEEYDNPNTLWELMYLGKVHP